MKKILSIILLLLILSNSNLVNAENKKKIDHNLKGFFLWTQQFPNGYSKVYNADENGKKIMTKEDIEEYKSRGYSKWKKSYHTLRNSIHTLDYSFTKSQETSPQHYNGNDICIKTTVHGNYNPTPSAENKMYVELKRSVDWWFDDSLGTKEITSLNIPEKLKWSNVSAGNYYFVFSKQYDGNRYYDEDAITDNCGTATQ